MGLNSLLFSLLMLTVAVNQALGDCGDEPDAVNPCKPVSDANKYCQGCTTTDVSLIPDPFDCHRYYYCQKAETLVDTNPYNCPEGTHFDQKNFVCVQGNECTSRCDGSGGSGGSGCTYSCDGIDGNGFIPDQFDCGAYHICTSGVMGPKVICPAGTPYFDGAKCQDDVTKCCHCHTYCYPNSNGPIPDPVDCTRYHLCTGEGDPVADGKCPSGQNYDSISAACSASAPCNTICKNVIGTDGCIELFTCTEFGFFAKCPFSCSEEYYHCKTISTAYIASDTCPTGQRFHPDRQTCVDEIDCPYPQAPSLV